MSIVWAFVILVMLMIPLLAIVIDSEFGRAFARRISGDAGGGGEELAERLEALEADVRYLSESMEALREETTFLRSLLEGESEPRSLPPGD
ncbi:MAG: hypothetical protein ACODAA_01440 [Gemmatimonadota bacterium]